MDKKTEALKLALDCVSTLANARDWVGCTPNERWDEDEMYAELCNATICLKKSLSIIQEALAEQPAQQQEPVAYASDVEFDDETEIIPAEQKGKLGTAGLRIPLYIKPPASKPWVGLTDDEIDGVLGGDIRDEPSGELEFVRAIEAKLREKNA